MGVKSWSNPFFRIRSKRNKTRITTFIKVKLMKSDDLTNIDKYRVHGTQLHLFSAKAFPPYPYYLQVVHTVPCLAMTWIEPRIEPITFPTPSRWNTCYATDAGSYCVDRKWPFAFDWWKSLRWIKIPFGIFVGFDGEKINNC